MKIKETYILRIPDFMVSYLTKKDVTELSGKKKEATYDVENEIKKLAKGNHFVMTIPKRPNKPIEYYSNSPDFYYHPCTVIDCQLIIYETEHFNKWEKLALEYAKEGYSFVEISEMLIKDGIDNSQIFKCAYCKEKFWIKFAYDKDTSLCQNCGDLNDESRMYEITFEKSVRYKEIIKAGSEELAEKKWWGSDSLNATLCSESSYTILGIVKKNKKHK